MGSITVYLPSPTLAGHLNGTDLSQKGARLSAMPAAGKMQVYSQLAVGKSRRDAVEGLRVTVPCSSLPSVCFAALSPDVFRKNSFLASTPVSIHEQKGKRARLPSLPDGVTPDGRCLLYLGDVMLLGTTRRFRAFTIAWRSGLSAPPPFVSDPEADGFAASQLVYGSLQPESQWVHMSAKKRGKGQGATFQARGWALAHDAMVVLLVQEGKSTGCVQTAEAPASLSLCAALMRERLLLESAPALLLPTVGTPAAWPDAAQTPVVGDDATRLKRIAAKRNEPDDDDDAAAADFTFDSVQPATKEEHGTPRLSPAARDDGRAAKRRRVHDGGVVIKKEEAAEANPPAANCMAAEAVAKGLNYDDPPTLESLVAASVSEGHDASSAESDDDVFDPLVLLLQSSQGPALAAAVAAAVRDSAASGAHIAAVGRDAASIASNSCDDDCCHFCGNDELPALVDHLYGADDDMAALVARNTLF